MTSQERRQRSFYSDLHFGAKFTVLCLYRNSVLQLHLTSIHSTLTDPSVFTSSLSLSYLLPSSTLSTYRRFRRHTTFCASPPTPHETKKFRNRTQRCLGPCFIEKPQTSDSSCASSQSSSHSTNWCRLSIAHIPPHSVLNAHWYVYEFYSFSSSAQPQMARLRLHI